MKILLNEALWRSLDLDDKYNREVALCSFYLGNGVEETRRLISLPPGDSDVEFTIETAYLCGLDHTKDFIVKGK